MNKAQFDYMCNNYGDPTLSADEKWKSVAYIATTTTRVPTFSAQYYLRTDQLRYSEDFGEPGFFLIDYLYSPHGPYMNEQGLTVTFIPLSMITAIAFTSRTTFREDENQEPTVKPEVPDVIIGSDSVDADATGVFTAISLTEDDIGGADPSIDYNIIYTGTGANTEDDSNLDLDIQEVIMDATNADDSDDDELLFALDNGGANPTIDADIIYDGNE